jgi:hypothetical protein
MAQGPHLHCIHCRGPKNGPATYERVAPCDACLAVIAEIEEIDEAPPDNSVWLVASQFAYREWRVYLILDNAGVFNLYVGKCQMGIGGRSLDPDISSLQALWHNTVWMRGWPRNHWPTHQEVLSVIHIHILKWPDYYQGAVGPFVVGPV